MDRQNPHQVNYDADGFRTVVKPSWMDRVIWGALYVALIVGTFYALVGCASSATDDLIKEAQTRQAKIEAQAQVTNAEANAHPTRHPLTETTQSVKSFRASATAITTIAAVLLAAAIGLAFTPLSVVSKIAVPILGAITALGFITVLALPFLPWLLGAVGVAIVGLVVYEVIRYKSLPKFIDGAEAEAEKYIAALKALFAPKTPATPVASLPTRS